MILVSYEGADMKTVTYMLAIFALIPINIIASEPDWSSAATIPGNELCKDFHGHQVCFRDGNRENIFELGSDQISKTVNEGAKHALYYPVTVSPLLIPHNTLVKFFNEDTNSPIRRFIYRAAQEIANFKDLDDVFKWLGLHKYPESSNELGPNPIPNMGGQIQSQRMGVTTRFIHGTYGTTVSCAACHSSNLFGTKVLGMSNRFPRANEFFRLGKMALGATPLSAYQALFNPSKEDLYIFRQSKNAIKFVEIKKPKALGLDTSLAQVGLSLSKRMTDEYATRNILTASIPRANKLRSEPADSKPAVWWNLKYKTRWLSDGSILSGNPVYTNFLWNEIGRGVDLKELESWLMNNQGTIKELTSFVFSAKAPRYTDFFGNSINVMKAKNGQKLFVKNCSGCHGIYEKGWEDPIQFDYNKQIATTKVWYHKSTPVIDVGTDDYRYKGMRYFYKDLNRLKISETIGVNVQPQVGYVPPPLVGIWARWPYFHNNSAPTLYDVITPDYKRPKNYIAVPAEDKDKDFDSKRVGYPRKDLVRLPYKKDSDYFYNSKTKGLSNKGHTSMLLDENGKEKFSDREKYEIIEFLKTL